MSALRDFEIEAIRLLADSALNPSQLDALAELPSPAEYEYTGSGYFLTLRSPALPTVHATLSRPFVVGEADGIRCGFVVFLASHELTLECHTWGEIDVPEDFRERKVLLSTPEVNYIDVTRG